MMIALYKVILNYPKYRGGIDNIKHPAFFIALNQITNLLLAYFDMDDCTSQIN